MIREIKLSCLITNYNQKEWIIDAVESVLHQNIQYNYEILIGDDGSNDGSLELLQQRYERIPQVRILIQDRKEGCKEFPNWRHSRLIFRLIDEARGEYVSILDGDDYFCDTNHFQHKIDLLERSENKRCVACYGNMYREIEGRLEFYTKVPYTEGQYQWSEQRPYIHLATAVIRKRFLEDVPRNIYYEEFADGQVTLWLARKGIFYFEPTPCFVYRILSNSIWNGASKELNMLRGVIVSDLNYQAYGEREMYIHCKNPILALYKKKNIAGDIDYEMWNAFTEKYHAKVAHMLLNRESLKLNERVWLYVFCFRLRAPWEILYKKLLGYGIGIVQICNPKNSMEQKQMLMSNWWARIRRQGGRGEQGTPN
ncbi:MAG: glycosyltransferase family 2 protein [Clostridiales bacterium]|nr:glycosyltransferase family 2 protein [Clostridiales bacterium]